MSEGAIIDVDGVCADFIKGVENVLDRKFPEEELRHWDLIHRLPSDLKEEVYEHLSEPDFWLKLTVIDGAQEGVKYFEDLGLPIIWATSPWSSCESWESARREWLNNHFDMDARGHAYHPVADKQGIDGNFILDDKPANVQTWLAAHPGKRGFIYDAPYNRDFNGATRFTWEKVRSLV
jgi:5'(3')-deoxyribonucleotidase